VVVGLGQTLVVQQSAVDLSLPGAAPMTVALTALAYLLVAGLINRLVSGSSS
jgi:hypothetical protein